MFGDDRYYKFMCLDVPKVVQSPGFDHGHDEDSRNGRAINIDILEGYIRTPDEFRGLSDKYRRNREVTGTSPGIIGPYGPK